MSAFRIALRVLRADRRTRMSAVLTGMGVAVATGLMLLLISLPYATQARADRAAWQHIAPVDPSVAAPMALAVGEDFYRGDEIVRVDVAAFGDPSRISLPEGIETFPGPGEVLLSPALARLAEHEPRSVLGDRFGGEVIGRIGQDALTHPGQLAALVGHEPSDLPSTALKQAGFASSGMVADATLDLLAGVGIVVLLVPSLVLVASAARLTAARREHRLAALRLAGATPRQVLAVVAGEIAIAAVGGALIGFAVSPLLHALAKYVPWDGGTWRAGDFALPLSVSLPVVVAIPLLVLLAAVLGLRRVVRSPLGAAGAHTPSRPHWSRLLSLPLAGALFAYLLNKATGQTGVVPMLASLGLVIGSAALVGPWVTAAVGSIFVRIWRRPPVLLAGRRLREDPKGAYRASAGVVLAVFTGSMALTLLPSFEAMAGSSSPYRESVLYVKTDRERAERIAERTDTALRRYGQTERAMVIGTVRVSHGDPADDATSRSALVLDCESAQRVLRAGLGGACSRPPGVYSADPVDLAVTTVASAYGQPGVSWGADTPVHDVRHVPEGVMLPLIVDPAVLPASVEPESATVVVTSTAGNRETVRTALVAASDGLGVSSVEARLADQRAQLAELRGVTVLGLVIAAVLSGCSAAIATAGSVMDRRRTFGALIAAGTPVRVLSRALRTEAAMPALVATVGAGAVGVAVGIGLFGLLTPAPVLLTPWIAAPVVLGFGTALIAASVCKPALTRVNSEPLTDE